MSDTELDKTIEELEAEVLAELEEAGDPTKKGAAPAEKSDKIDEPTPGGETEDLGGADEKGSDKDREIGKKATANPWGEGATTLEWTVSSPPPFHTFGDKVPKT